MSTYFPCPSRNRRAGRIRSHGRVFNIVKLAGSAGCLKPEDHSDIGQAKKLSKEYGDELCSDPVTDFFRYNGTDRAEPKEAAQGATMEFPDQQLADVVLLMFTTRQVRLREGAGKCLWPFRSGEGGQ